MRKLVFSLLLIPAAACATLHYTLAPIPTSKAIAVSITDDEPDGVETYRIPAWCPGFYFIQKYQDKIFDVAASNDSSQVPIVKAGERAWTIQNPSKKPVTISYKVQGDDAGLGFFGVSVRADKAFVNGAAGFMYKEDKLTAPIELTIKVPEGWDIATAMSRSDAGWSAKGYDEFIDMPIQMGAMKHTSFKVGEYDFDIAWVSQSGDYKPDMAKQTEVVRKVSAEAIELFGSAPFKRYQYIVHLTSQGFLGGLEHRASTCLAMPNQTGMDLSTLAAHEFFHTWNVKNIRPKVLGPFDYTKQVRTGNLWFAEGVTDYYAHMDSYRAGLYDVAWLYRVLSGQIRQLQGSPTRLKITLEEACRQTWEHGGFGYDDLDYYNKGLLSGLIFDAAIRTQTNGDKSLDDVMQLMYERYRLPNPGYEEDAIRQHINAVAEHDLSPIYNQAIRSMKELPYEQLSGIGLRVLVPNRTYASAGFTTLKGAVVQVSPEAANAGLKNGDLIMGASNVQGDRATVTFKRGDQVMRVTVPVQIDTATDWRLEEDPFALDQARANLLGWLAR